MNNKIEKTIESLKARKDVYVKELNKTTDYNKTEELIFDIKVINEKIKVLERALDIIFE
jgi:seryl-tRNA synthetase